MEYEYSVDTHELKGNDALLASAITRLGFQYKIIPVLRTQDVIDWHEDNDKGLNVKSKVYPLTGECMSFLFGEVTTLPETQYKDIEF